MSDLTPLARLLEHHDQRTSTYESNAEALVADPALLDALAAAGVLREVYTLARHDPKPSMSGPKVQRAGESPDRTVMERVSSLPHSEGRWIERRYVTEWSPDARP